MNKLIVVNKPSGISSNSYLGKIKRKYKNKKAGFSGTLDPFASGCLIVAFGQYPKLFNYLQKTPKSYRATIWFGAYSPSLDTENIEEISIIEALNLDFIKKEINKLKGEISYTPPKFSAKKINGKRAYDLARAGASFEMKKSIMNVYEVKIINYSHPFLTIELMVSEGSYIRSYAQILAKNLGTKATLSALHRISEGKFKFQNEIDLNPVDYLKIPQNFYQGEEDDFDKGIKLNINNFTFKDDGEYFLCFKEFFSIIEIKDEIVKYKLNKVLYANTF